MKHLKNWKIFETIKVNSAPTIHEIVKHQTTFQDREFNPLLLSEELIEGTKDYLYDLSEDNCDIEITFKRTIPKFKVKRNLEVTDLLCINIKSQDGWSAWRPQSIKRHYINNKILEDTSYEIQSFVSDYGLEIGICSSYLPFESVKEFFKYRNTEDHLIEVTIILFKSETPT